MGITEFESVSPAPKAGILARLEDIPKSGPFENRTQNFCLQSKRDTTSLIAHGAAIRSCNGIPALQVRCVNC